ncbi:ECF transporter S component [Paludibacterium purpuratum]|uniref:Energy-coupling factor transport system substrate-specific component n=1 Tax=Paludibacterium purpuratum TaxID=1144873 RepID=A0A4R7AW34_9NEIS|nr:ECF transporter S component [Paludibacterium purpuratum]TDR71593.1 energy-coupling factor transport system substrate-specific component [Paludibacterium purpuratum]
MKNSMWSLKLSTSALVLIPAAVGINYIGKLFAGLLKLPLWLDAIGTVLAAMLAGPVVGAICGAINNVIYGLTMDPISFIYGLTSIGIGLSVGVLAHRGRITGIGSAVVVGLIAAVVSTVISTPINIGFWGGQTGNVWGDLVFAWMAAHHFPVWMSSTVDEFIVDVPDKIATVIVAYGIFKGLPQKMTILFRHDSQTEQL